MVQIYSALDTANLGISLAFVVGILVAFFYHARRDALPKRRFLRTAAVLFGGVALPVSIQASINWVVHADVTPFSVADLLGHQLWTGAYHLKYATGFWDDKWHPVRYLSPWVSDAFAFRRAPMSFYVDHPWTALRTWVVHLYGAVNYDFFWLYLHEPKYVRYSWHQLLSSAIQYFGVIGGVGALSQRLRRRRQSDSDLVILLGSLVAVFSAGVIAFSAVETRFGFAIVAILSFAAVAWFLKSNRRSLLANTAGFGGLVLYIFLSAELSGWIVAHTVPGLPGVPAVAAPVAERYKRMRKMREYELLVSRYRRERRPDKAVALCEDAGQSYLSKAALAGCSNARVDIARALKSEGKTMEAIAHLKTAMQLAPESSRPVRLLADIYRGRGKKDEAIRHYQESLRINSSDLAARVHLAVLYQWHLGRSEAAIEELKAARLLAPNSSWPVSVMANIHRERGRNDEALSLYKESLRIDPKNLAARVHLALVYRSLGRRERAIEELKTASGLVPESSRPLRLLADIYREMGNEKLALAHCRKAVQVEPENIHARVLLGRTYEQYGRQEEAIRAYRDVLAIDSDNRLAKTALSRLLK